MPDVRQRLNPCANTAKPHDCLYSHAGTGLAIAFSYTLPLADEHTNSLLVPVALSTVWAGFLMLTTRKKAIMQVLGYLLLENGIFLFGLLLLDAIPFLVEVNCLRIARFWYH